MRRRPSARSAKGAARRARRGFTLAELLIALALTAMLLTAAALGIFASLTSHSYNSEKTELLARARGVLDRLARDAQSADVCTCLNSRTLRITMYGGETRTYQWDGTPGGGLVLTVDDGTSQSVTLTRYVQLFEVQDADAEKNVVRARLAIQGSKAAVEATITTVPRHQVFERLPGLP